MTGKPFILSKLAIGDPDPINPKTIVTFLKFEEPRISSKGRYQIKFIRDENSVGPKELIWKYSKPEDRDCEYDKIKELYGQVVE